MHIDNGMIDPHLIFIPKTKGKEAQVQATERWLCQRNSMIMQIIEETKIQIYVWIDY